MADRSWDKNVTKEWTGDVWKLIPILAKYRPDITVEVLDCWPTGLLQVKKLDTKSSALQDNYETIVREFRDVTLEDYGIGKFFSEFEFTCSNTELSKLSSSPPAAST
jgi:hypothetical protein